MAFNINSSVTLSCGCVIESEPPRWEVRSCQEHVTTWPVQLQQIANLVDPLVVRQGVELGEVYERFQAMSPAEKLNYLFDRLAMIAPHRL